LRNENDLKDGQILFFEEPAREQPIGQHRAIKKNKLHTL
jgi:hypothetical protein